MSYILRRNEDGKFVMAPGQFRSYTPNPRNARRFATAECAEDNRCGNETVQRYELWADYTPLQHTR